MGRLEAGVSINPHKSNKTTYRPDGSLVTTTVERENSEPHVRVGRGHLSEADHVIVAMDEGIPVVHAEASDEAGVTRLAAPSATVAAAHWDRGGDGWDNMVIHALGADRGSARSRASLIKSRRSHERDAIATLLAVQGSASGSEMAIAAATARENQTRGRRVRVTVSVIDKDGTKTSMQASAREKDRTVMLPGEWAVLRPKTRAKQTRRRLAVAA